MIDKTLQIPARLVRRHRRTLGLADARDRGAGLGTGPVDPARIGAIAVLTVSVSSGSAWRRP